LCLNEVPVPSQESERSCTYGLPIFASSILIYKELGWESLAEKGKRRKLQMIYNIQNNNAPMYLCALIPPSLRDWHHNDKTDMRLYLLGKNRNSKKKQNMEAGLK
jgi:hypothetical protein